MRSPIAYRLHRLDVARFRVHHGPVLTWIYAWRRVLLLAFAFTPLVTLVFVAAPWLLIGVTLCALLAGVSIGSGATHGE